MNYNDYTKIFALGGLCEVGKNMYCVMHNDEIIITDAGVTFPEGEILGVDYVIPDFTFLKQNQSKIKALIITHGHEDHIGGIPYLLQMVEIPIIYAPRQATGLIKRKLADRDIKYNNIITYNEETIIKFKYMTVEFFMTTHSIPDSHGICITTPNGVVVTTGDFKFDLTPIGPPANIHKMAEIGSRGVTLLLSDSTNALNQGFSASESKVDEALSNIFSKHKGRIIIATFASNIYRLKHIVDTCKRNNRRILTFGRSMENNIDISIEGGYIKNKEIFITNEEARNMPNDKICILCTGSQGEPLAALSRIANGTDRQIKLQDDDLVIFSSSTIPGNALSVSRTINKLYLRGVEVYTNTLLKDIHTSGHASEEELKLMIRLFKPKYFMPFHGEYRMLKKHADIGILCGIPKENTFILGNGEVLSMYKGEVKKNGSVQAADAYVDGNRIGDVSGAVLKDRKIMANDGIIVTISNIDTSSHQLINSSNVITRGFVLVNENMDLVKELENITNKAVKNSKWTNYGDLKNEIINALYPYVYERTGRKPIILPIIMDIKKEVKQTS